MGDLKEKKSDNKNKKEYNYNITDIALIILSILLFVAIIVVVYHVITSLNAVQASSQVNNHYARQTLSDLTKMQYKIIDGVSITFLITLLVALFITIGIALINKYDERFRNFRKSIDYFTNEKSNELKDKQKEVTECIVNSNNIIIEINKQFNRYEERIDNFINEKSNELKDKQKEVSECIGNSNKIIIEINKQFNKYEERINNFTNEKFNELTKKHEEVNKKIDETTVRYENLIKEAELLRLVNKYFPHIVSIYLLSENPTMYYSRCYRIGRHIDNIQQVFKELINFGYIDAKNNEIFQKYLGETIYNLETNMKENSGYARVIINNIKTIMEQINSISDSNLDIKQE